MNERNGLDAYVRRLQNEYSYPARDIQTEVPYSFAKARYRLDVLVMREGSPYIVVEIKKRVSDVTQDQLLSYARASGAHFVVVSDGHIDSCYRVVRDAYETRLERIPDIPPLGKSLDQIGDEVPKLTRLDPQRLPDVIWNLINLTRTKGLDIEESSREILKLLVLKAYDEDSGEGLFRAKYPESPENLKSRIDVLALKASEKYPMILKEGINLDSELLSRAVYEIQKYALRDSVKPGADALVRFPMEALLGRHYYMYSTQGELAKFMIDLLNPKRASTFIDPACGVGVLLVEAASRGLKVTGIDRNSRVAQFAEMNLALSGLSGEISTMDSLRLAQLNTLEKADISVHSFDYAAVVPPFGEKISDDRLNNFYVGRRRKSQSVEALFLELTLLLLKKGGRMVIVLPEGVLFADLAYDAREFILKRSIVKAIVSLPPGILSPYLSIKPSALVLEASPERGTSPDDQVFVAIVDDKEQLESVVSSFRDFETRKVIPKEENLFVTNLSSAKQMNASYLKGMSSMVNIVLRDGLIAKTGEESVELQEIADLTPGVRWERMGVENSKGNVWYIKAGNVKDLAVSLGESDRMKTSSDYSRWIAHAGDVLVTSAGTVGRVALVEEKSMPLIVGSNVVKISIQDKTRVLPEFLLAYLMSKPGQTQIGMYTAGSTIRAVSISGLRRMKIPVLPMIQQKKVASQVKKLLKIRQERDQILMEWDLKEKKLLEELDDIVKED
jgi:type I restriction enzyme M protein